MQILSRGVYRWKGERLVFNVFVTGTEPNPPIFDTFVSTLFDQTKAMCNKEFIPVY